MGYKICRIACRYDRVGGARYDNFVFNDTATTEIYTLSLHDALPICLMKSALAGTVERARATLSTISLGQKVVIGLLAAGLLLRSEEHTSELQSRQYLVCRLLLEKKNVIIKLIIQAVRGRLHRSIKHI